MQSSLIVLLLKENCKGRRDRDDGGGGDNGPRPRPMPNPDGDGDNGPMPPRPGPRPTPTPAPPLQLFKQPVQLTFTQVEGRPTKKGLRRYLQWQIRLSSLFRLHCSRKSGEVPQHPPFPVVVKERVLYFGSIESKQWFPSTKPSSCLGAGGHSGSLQRALCVSGSPLIPSSSYHTHPEYTLPNPLRNVFFTISPPTISKCSLQRAWVII